MDFNQNFTFRGSKHLMSSDPFVKLKSVSVKLPPISPCIHRKKRVCRRKIIPPKSLFTQLPLIPYSERFHEDSRINDRPKPSTPFFSFNSDAIKDYQLQL
jgi:hypothetical protein